MQQPERESKPPRSRAGEEKDRKRSLKARRIVSRRKLKERTKTLFEEANGMVAVEAQAVGPSNNPRNDWRTSWQRLSSCSTWKVNRPGCFVASLRRKRPSRSRMTRCLGYRRFAIEWPKLHWWLLPGEELLILVPASASYWESLSTCVAESHKNSVNSRHLSMNASRLSFKASKGVPKTRSWRDSR